MKRPLLRAASFTCSITLKTLSGASGALMTSCTGSPPVVPGSEGSEKTKACTPSTAETAFCASGFNACADRARSFHGLRIIPAKPLLGPLVPLMTKRVSLSGKEPKTRSSLAP